MTQRTRTMPKRWTRYGWVPEREITNRGFRWVKFDAAPIFRKKFCPDFVRVRMVVTLEPLGKVGKGRKRNV